MGHFDFHALSTELALRLQQLTQDLVLVNDDPRIVASAVAVSLAHEHWDAVRPLLATGMLPSAVVVHRAQFEATVRSVWLAYAASDNDVAKVAAELSAESEQRANHMPLVADMMDALVGKAPTQAIDALSRFKGTSWRALTSYAHAGIHAINRHREGYPEALLDNVLKNANGLGVIGYFQLVGLCGQQPLQRKILGVTQSFSECLPHPA